jgi:ATP-dependent protease ClpP protease subunit
MKKIAITGIIGYDTTAAIVRDFLRDANGEAVEAEISSPGGLVSQGLEIYNLFRNYSGHTTARIVGYAMSMASYIPLSFDRVLAEDNGVFMIHNARGGVWGDHNDIIAYGNYVKGLSGVLGKQYSKTTGKTAGEIAEWMNKETFFFGQEMVDAGFVHEIIVTEKDKDKAQAVAVATAVFMDTMAKLGGDAAQAADDMNKASAILNLATAPAVTPTTTGSPQLPAVAGSPQKEVQQMALKKLLADNPAAQAEYDAALAAARTEGESTGKAAIQATIDRVTPILASGAYPASVSNVALAVLKGTELVGTLTAVVATVDAMREDAATAAAAIATAALPNTPAGQVPVHQPGAEVKDQAGLDAEIARAKAERGN